MLCLPVIHRRRVFPGWVVPLQITYSIGELSRYHVFCGHLDWSGLDCIPDEKFTFKFLRQPLTWVIIEIRLWKVY